MSAAAILALGLACTSASSPSSPDPGEPMPQPDLSQVYPCPRPPDDAVRFELGTFLGDQVFYDTDGRSGWFLALSGLSYVHEQRCSKIFEYMEMLEEVKSGARPGEFTVELLVDLPGQRPADWLGEHPMNDGHLFSGLPAHTSKLGWNDGEGYRWVQSLPNGWTRSTVCIGEITTEYVYLTFLWEPLDGPFTTNDHVQVHHPIWFNARIYEYEDDPVWGTHRGCESTTWVGMSWEDW